MSTKQDPPEVAEFHKELYSLFDSRTASASKIDRLTKLAFKSAKVQYHTSTTQPFCCYTGGGGAGGRKGPYPFLVVELSVRIIRLTLQ
jgi:hypothetical protein